jgi:mannose-6-phosphate isomerase
VNAGHRLSLQYHEQKEESCYVLSGRLILVQGESEEPLTEQEVGSGAAWRNYPGLIHTIEAVEDADVLRQTVRYTYRSTQYRLTNRPHIGSAGE